MRVLKDGEACVVCDYTHRSSCSFLFSGPSSQCAVWAVAVETHSDGGLFNGSLIPEQRVLIFDLKLNKEMKMDLKDLKTCAGFSTFTFTSPVLVVTILHNRVQLNHKQNDARVD